MYYFIVSSKEDKDSGQKIWAQIRSILEERKHQDYRVFFAETNEDAARISREVTCHATERCVMIVIGRAGMLNEAANGSCFDWNNVIFSFIPTNSDKNFPAIPHRKINLKQYLEQIFSLRKERLADYGLLDCPEGQRRFLVSTGFGLSAELLQGGTKCGEGDRTSGKPVSFFILRDFMKWFLTVEPARGYLVLDGERRIDFNNIYHVSAMICSGRNITRSGRGREDGNLTLLVVSTRHRTRLLRIVLSNLLGIRMNLCGVHTFSCRAAEIHLERPLPVHTDGKYCGEVTDARINCVPRRLRLLMY